MTELTEMQLLTISEKVAEDSDALGRILHDAWQRGMRERDPQHPCVNFDSLDPEDQAMHTFMGRELIKALQVPALIEIACQEPQRFQAFLRAAKQLASKELREGLLAGYPSLN